MKSFELHRPETLEAAYALLPERRGPAADHDPRALAGGQDLLTEMKEHLVEPGALVDLSALPGLDAIEVDGDGALRIGALVTLARLARDERVRATWTALAEAAESVGSPQIRTLATVGGNLCQRPRCMYYRLEEAKCIKKGGAECFSYGGNNKYNAVIGGGPSYIVHPSDLAPALVCLDAEVTIGGPDGERTLPLERFFTLPSEGSILRENVLRANELVLGLRVPAPDVLAKSTYLKFRERESFDFALGAVAVSIGLDVDTISSARVVLGAVAPIPWRSRSTERVLVGRKMDDETWTAAAEDVLGDAEPLEQNAYKVPLTRGLLRKALRSLA